MLKIEIPDNIALALNLPGKQITEALKKLLAVKLYDNGILGIGKARELANLSKIEFLSLLKEEHVTLNFDSEELDEEFKQLEEAGI